MSDCFWTDMVGCAEACGVGTTVGIFNLKTWNLLGSCTDPNDGSIDSFGDVSTTSAPTPGTLGPSAHPWSGVVAAIATVRESKPGCLTGTPQLHVDVYFQPPPGGEGGLGWTFKGTFNLSPFVATAHVLDQVGNVLETVSQYGDAIASDSGPLWHVGMSVTAPTAHATAAFLAVSLDWSGTPPGSGLNLTVDHLAVDVFEYVPH